jgi:hypothetical protein
MLLQQFSANPPLVVKRVPGAMRISWMPYASACPGREELPERGTERHHGNSADR